MEDFLYSKLFFIVLSLQRCTPNPIAHGSKKSGKCVVTIGTATFYTQYYIRVWARNEVGNGPIPEPVIGLSAVKGMSSIIYYSLCYVFNYLLQAIYTGISTGLVLSIYSMRGKHYPLHSASTDKMTGMNSSMWIV